MGYFPSDKPKYTIAVVIQNSQQSKLIYGADVSGKVFKDISDRIYSRYLTKPLLNYAAIPDTMMYNGAGIKNDLATVLKYLDIPFIDSAVSGVWRKMMYRNNNAGLTGDYSATGNIIPDATGLGLKDAVYLLENKGLKVAVNGKGKVMNQSIAAGNNYTKGQKIILWLN